MQSIQAHDVEKENRLRFVFDDRVVSFGLGADVTFRDVARRLGELSHKHYGNPIGIDFMLAARRPVNGVLSRQSRITLPGPTAGARPRAAASSKITALSRKLPIPSPRL